MCGKAGDHPPYEPTEADRAELRAEERHDDRVARQRAEYEDWLRDTGQIEDPDPE